MAKQNESMTIGEKYSSINLALAITILVLFSSIKLTIDSSTQEFILKEQIHEEKENKLPGDNSDSLSRKNKAYSQKLNWKKFVKDLICKEDFLILVLGFSFFCSVHSLKFLENNILLMLLLPFILATTVKLFLAIIVNWFRPEGN